MANFIADNADLQFYLDKWIDWSALHEMSELNPDDPEAPQSAQEAKEFWREILELIAENSRPTRLHRTPQPSTTRPSRSSTVRFSSPRRWTASSSRSPRWGCMASACRASSAA